MIDCLGALLAITMPLIGGGLFDLPFDDESTALQNVNYVVEAFFVTLGIIQQYKAFYWFLGFFVPKQLRQRL